MKHYTAVQSVRGTLAVVKKSSEGFFHDGWCTVHARFEPRRVWCLIYWPLAEKAQTRGHTGLDRRPGRRRYQSGPRCTISVTNFSNWLIFHVLAASKPLEMSLHVCNTNVKVTRSVQSGPNSSENFFRRAYVSYPMHSISLGLATPLV